MFREWRLIRVREEFGQSRGPQTMTVLGQNLFYPLTYLCWHSNSRFRERRGCRIGGGGKGDLQKGQNVRARLEGRSLGRSTGGCRTSPIWTGGLSVLFVVEFFPFPISLDFNVNTQGHSGNTGGFTQRGRRRRLDWRGGNRCQRKRGGGLSQEALGGHCRFRNRERKEWSGLLIRCRGRCRNGRGDDARGGGCCWRGGSTSWDSGRLRRQRRVDEAVGSSAAGRFLNLWGPDKPGNGRKETLTSRNSF